MPNHTPPTVSVEEPPQELKEKVPQWPAVATVEVWRSLSFPEYVDLADDVARDTPALLAQTAPLSGDEKEKKVHRRVKGPARGLRSPDGR